MKNLNNLVIQYKETKDKKILDEIFDNLKSLIEKKARFIFYRKKYPLNMYNKCHYCKECKNDKQLKDMIKEEERRRTCEECKECICNRGFFNLRENNLCTYEDVVQELNMEILKMINNDSIKDFDAYLISALWHWHPPFLTLDFVESIKHRTMSKIDENEEEEEVDITDEKVLKPDTNFNLENIFGVCVTENEKKICEMYLENPQITQEEIAEKLGTYKMDISRIINKLRKKLKKFVTK